MVQSGFVNFDYYISKSQPGDLLKEAQSKLPTLNTQQYLRCNSSSEFCLVLKEPKYLSRILIWTSANRATSRIIFLDDENE